MTAHWPPAENFTVSVLGSLVAYYRLEGNAQDASGQGNHGPVNGAGFVTGKVGTQALGVNGTSSYVQIPVSIRNDFTIALWLKTTGTGRCPLVQRPGHRGRRSFGRGL